MKLQPFALLLGALSILGMAMQALPAHAAQRVSSEAVAAPKAGTTVAPRWRADGFPSKLVSRMQYQELSAARILQVEKYNATRKAKPTQIGVARNAASDGAGNAALPGLSWIALADGSAVARIEVMSPLALGVRVGLKVGMLDPRAELRFAGSADPSNIVATMSGREILALTDKQGIFWTPGTDGEKQYIEVYVPAGGQRLGTRLQAPQMSHLLTNSARDFKMLKGIGDSGSCNVNTICRVAELGDNYVLAKNAVARMVYVRDGNGYTCTGTLLNDTVGASQIPYFYSAHHCISNQTVATTLNTYWKFEAGACNSTAVVAGGNVVRAGGSDYLYSNVDTDALLVRLHDTPPAGSELAGWDSNVLAASSNITGIHHPAGDLKKVSTGQRLQQDAFQSEVGWLSGTTEGGSSGSGLFTHDAASYYLRGGLYGGSAACANSGSLSNPANRDYYSRFDVVFPNIQSYLAPAVANVAPVANFIFVANGLTVNFTDTSTDSDGTIASRSWNFGDGTSSAAANPVKTYTAPGTYNVALAVTDNGGLGHNRTRAVVVVAPKLPVHDFNGDGRSDILWRNGSTGANVTWYSASSSTALALAGVGNLNWKIVGVGDFNGDGKSDILWRDSATGTNAIWNSGNRDTQQTIAGVTDLNWKVVGVGDFNGDGKSDILWRNSSDGTNALWNSANRNTQPAITSVTDLNWEIVGVGDFNGDGRSDVLWRNRSTGANALWKSANNAIQQPLPSVTNTAWKVAAIGDYNADGKSDILWRSTSTGDNVVWRGATFDIQQQVSGLTNMSWVVVP